jgi:hypothetical protein
LLNEDDEDYCYDICGEGHFYIFFILIYFWEIVTELFNTSFINDKIFIIYIIIHNYLCYIFNNILK